MADTKTPDSTEGPENAPWQDANGEKNPFDDDSWDNANTVLAEQQIKMDKRGDKFIAQWLGMDEPMSSGMVQGHFTRLVGYPDGPYFMNLPKDLETKLRTVPLKATVRIEWVDSINTGQNQPMRIFDVKWR